MGRNGVRCASRCVIFSSSHLRNRSVTEKLTHTLMHAHTHPWREWELWIRTCTVGEHNDRVNQKSTHAHTFFYCRDSSLPLNVLTLLIKCVFCSWVCSMYTHTPKMFQLCLKTQETSTVCNSDSLWKDTHTDTHRHICVYIEGGRVQPFLQEL